MSRIRLVFFGTPDFAHHCLQNLIEDEHYEVVGVVSQPDRPAGRRLKLQPSPVKQLAKDKNIPVETPQKVGDSLDWISSLRAEAAVVVAYGQILPEELIRMFSGKMVNVHASLLPRWRGAAPIQRAIMAGDKETGASLQQVVKKLDAGDVLGERKILLDSQINATKLHELMKPLATQLLHIELMDFIRGNLSPRPQDKDKVTYAHKIAKSEALIDWDWPSDKISDLIRGLSMGPQAKTLWQGKDLKIIEAESMNPESLSSSLNPTDSQQQGTPGQVILIDSNSFVISCGRGCLKVTQVQPASRSRQSVTQFLQGYHLKEGSVFGI